MVQTMVKRSTRKRDFPWANYSDEQLLDMRFRDLGVRISGTELENRIDRLDRELEELLLADPFVPAAQRVQLTAAPRCRVVGKHEIKQRHEVALARAERAVEVRRLTASVALATPRTVITPAR